MGEGRIWPRPLSWPKRRPQVPGPRSTAPLAGTPWPGSGWRNSTTTLTARPSRRPTHRLPALTQRSETPGDRPDVAAAVAELTSVLRRSGRSPEREARLSAAGPLYARKAIIAGGAGRSGQAIGDLTRAIGFGHEALELTERT